MGSYTYGLCSYNNRDFVTVRDKVPEPRDKVPEPRDKVPDPW